MKTKFVLSICGGGVRDIIPARILDLISEHFQFQIGEKFDLIVGTSGGGLISLYANADIKDKQPFASLFTKENVDEMLNKSCWDKMMKEIQFEPVYDGKGKTNQIKRYFGEDMFMKQLIKPTAITTYNITQRKPEIFTSYTPSSNMYPVWQVADATSAAVPYFPPVKMINEQLYIDGAFPANNPVLVAYTEARKLFGKKANIRILSLGSGLQPGNKDWASEKDVVGWGTIQWIQNGLLDLMMDAPNDLMTNEVINLLKMDGLNNSLLHIDERIPTTKIDDSSSIERLLKSADNAFNMRLGDLVHFFDSKKHKTWDNQCRSFEPDQ